MDYIRESLPLDNAGTYLYATHYHQHKIGGEVVRESWHACFVIGHIEQSQQLTDITDLCTIVNPASRESRHVVKQFKMPNACFTSGGCVTTDKPLLALPGFKGLIAVLNLDAGKWKWYYPH